MPIIIISSASHSSAEQLALDLGNKTGWPTLSRTELADQAHERGIKLGRLETSIIKKPIKNERLAREKEIYLAYITAAICEKVKDGNLIYQGRAGHLLLPGVHRRLRVGLIAPKEMRIETAMSDLHLAREKVSTYLDQLDEDYEKWVRYVHKAQWRDLSLYDLCINLQNTSLSHAADLLVSMASHSDYRPSAKTLKTLDNLYLAARARMALATSDKTRSADLWVLAADGVVTVTCMPDQKGIDQAIVDVIEPLDGCRKVQCTIAETNIMWLQEKFQGAAENFQHITQIAQRWGAAIELLRVAPQSSAEHEEYDSPVAEEIQKSPADNDPHVYTGGVEDDGPETVQDDGGLEKTLEELVSIGRSAGGKTIYGDGEEIMEAVKDSGNCSLVVLGEMFLDKGKETRKRQIRELAMNVRERLKIPVITSDEIKTRFFFGYRQAVKLLTYAAIVVCIYVAVFSFQDVILNFLGGEIHEKVRVISAIGVALFVPLVAYLYSTVTGLLLKLIGID